MVHCISGKKNMEIEQYHIIFFKTANVPNFSENGDRTK